MLDSYVRVAIKMKHLWQQTVFIYSQNSQQSSNPWVTEKPSLTTYELLQFSKSMKNFGDLKWHNVSRLLTVRMKIQ